MQSKLRNTKLRNTADERAFIVLSLPFVIFFFVFMILPILSSLALSFTDYDMVQRPNFVGLENYLRMFTSDEVFPVAVKNTLLFGVVTGPLSFILAFLLAWFINEFNRTARAFLTFLFYCPALVGNAYFIWKIAFSGDSYGYVNSLLLTIGFINEPIQWFRNVSFNMPVIMIVMLWQSMGVSFLSDIAGLQNVNQEMYEAGAIDGIRTRWHELWYITLPSVKNILLFGAVMQIQAVFSASAICIELAGFPSVNNSVDTIMTHITDVGTQRYEMGYAAALSVFLFVLMALFRVLVGKLLKLLGK